MAKTWLLIAAAAAAAAGHTLVPDHWLPYVFAAQARTMSPRRAARMAGAGAVAHLFSTVLIGLSFAVAGGAVAASVTRELERLVGLVVMVVGIYFLWRGWSGRHSEGHGCGGHGGGQGCGGHGAATAVPKSGSDYVLGTLLGLRPCAEALPIFLAVSTRGLFASLLAVGVWAAMTVLSMVGIVWLFLKGLESVRWNWLERNGKLLSGAVITLVGLITLL